MVRARRSSLVFALRQLAAGGVLLAACGRREPPQAPDLVDLLDRYRRAAGVAAVSKDAALARAAAAHAAEMERLGYYGHYSPTPGNRTPDDRLARAGWPADRRYVELLALADSPEAALASWKKRPAHDRALRDPGLGAAGVARRGRCWVLLLGATARKHVTPR